MRKNAPQAFIVFVVVFVLVVLANVFVLGRDFKSLFTEEFVTSQDGLISLAVVGGATLLTLVNNDVANVVGDVPGVSTVVYKCNDLTKSA